MSSELHSKLDGWKEIAAYIGRDVTTAIRWEHERQLPVHRVPGVKRGGVFAYPREIDHWLQGDGRASITPCAAERQAVSSVAAPAVVAQRRGARAGRAAVVVVLASASAAALLGVVRTRGAAVDSGSIDRIEYGTREIVARSISGQALWVHALAGRHEPTGGDEPGNAAHARYAIADLDADGDPEAVVGVRLGLPDTTTDELMCFSSKGELRWRQRFEDEIGFRGGRYGPPWHDGRVAVYRTPAGVRIAWSQNHLIWWPSVVLTLDPQGRRLGRFVHSGAVRAMAVLAGGEAPQLLVAGVSNSQRAASFAVIDARRPVGRSPEPPGSPFECIECDREPPARYFVFPPSELNTVVGQPYNQGVNVAVRGDRVVVQTAEADGDYGFAGLVFELSRGFDLLRASAADSFGVHDRLQAAGRLDHAASGCPMYARAPRAREWTRIGWRELASPNSDLVASSLGAAPRNR